jgi:nucleotide-binding universal stress UspA family protein
MFKKIVWATDGSEHSDRALEYVKQLTHDDGAAVLVVHVVEKIVSGRAAGMSLRTDERDVEAKLNRQAQELGEAGLEATVHIAPDVTGQPAHQIAEIAHEAGADLIVVGTRGHSAIGGLLLGSVTQRLLHVASCPILAVPPVAAAAPVAEPAVAG